MDSHEFCYKDVGLLMSPNSNVICISVVLVKYMLGHID